MIHYVDYIKDSVGNNYLGIKIDKEISLPFLDKLKDYLSDSEYKIYTENQEKRDGGHHHMTVINVMDYNSLSKSMGVSEFLESVDKLLKFPIDDIKMMGLGSASKGDNTTYFIVCNSDKLNSVRKRYDLPDHDFHVTLGFKWKDVFGVPKNEVLGRRSKFLKLLSDEFYKKENFNFIKKIENFRGNPDIDIIPISISDDYIKVSSGDVIMDIGVLDEPLKFWIMTSYKSEENIKRLPMTEIIRIFNLKNK
jgi:hypothetical protein